MGQIPTRFAAAFYSSSPLSVFPRITRPLSGTAFLLHAKPQHHAHWCRAFNAANRTRQLFMTAEGAEIEALLSREQCAARVGRARGCLYADGRAGAMSVFEPEHMPGPRSLKIRWGAPYEMGGSGTEGGGGREEG